MKSGASDVLTLIGRIFLAVIFLVSGYSKIGGFEGLVGQIASKGFPAAQAFALTTIVIEIGMGLMLIVGWKARWAAFLIAVFTAVVTVLFHNFWAVPEAQKMLQQTHFLKNLAIVGGLLMVVAFGPGRLSVDKR
ncbi:MAG TPA: DoxX family protein [Burkholderiaceae bacterium]|jgi:putative oxidoreductase|nr:DoxX family protein [Burkholderiaceae bacterium]